MSWHYTDGQSTFGPMETSDLLDHLFKGTINGETLVWREGMPDWLPLAQTELINGFLEEQPGELEAVPAEESGSAPAPAGPRENAAFDPRAGLEEELKNLDPQFRQALHANAGMASMQAPATPAINEFQGQIDGYLSTFTNGVNWFYWIAGLTVVNVALIALNSPVILAYGMALPELGMYLAYDVETGEMNTTLMWTGVALGLILSGVCAAIGWFANQGHKAVFAVGIALMTLDTLLFVFPLFSIIALAVHGYALWAMINGIFALIQLERLDATPATKRAPAESPA